MTCVAIVDYGMSNLRSVRQALLSVAPGNARIRIVEDEDGIRDAKRIVFPGQGAAADCMAALDRRNLKAALTEAIAEKPFLGICMGMQMLFDVSMENGGTGCLEVFPGTVRHLAERRPPEPGHKIPHTGWNQVKQEYDHPIWHGIEDGACFYFVHSYCAVPDDDGIVAGTTEHGNRFASAVADGFAFAVQFHPEKSAANGARLLRNFLQWRV